MLSTIETGLSLGEQRGARAPRAVLAVHIGRAAMRSGLLWGAGFALYAAVQMVGYAIGYHTLEERRAFAIAYGGNPGLDALYGRAVSIDTVAGYAQWRVLGVLSLFAPIWAILLSTRLLRGEEDAGRCSLFAAGRVSRRGVAAQSMAGLAAALLGQATVLFIGAVSASFAAPSPGVSVVQAANLCAAVSLASAAFLSVGALASQLCATRRQAAALAAGVFVLCLAARIAGDSWQSMRWASWIGPLGWIERLRALTGPRPAWYLLLTLAIVVTAFGAQQLAQRRDIGAGVLPQRDSRAPRLTLLSGQFSAAARFVLPSAAGWLAAIVAMAAVLGGVATSTADDDNRSLQRTLQRLGGGGHAVAGYLGLTSVMLAAMVCLAIAQQIASLSQVEDTGTLAALLAQGVPRARWLALRTLLIGALAIVAGVAGGLSSWLAAGNTASGVSLPTILAAGANLVFPALLLLGIGACAFGLRSRMAAAVVYAVLAWSFLSALVGSVIGISHWILDTSILFHVSPAPAAAPNWGGNVLMAALGLAFAVGGIVAFRRRDIG